MWAPVMQKAKRLARQLQTLRASKARAFDLTPAEAVSVQQYKGDDDGQRKVTSSCFPCLTLDQILTVIS